MDITPASLEQVVTARGGRKVVIDADVGDVARQLKEIEPSLILRWHEGPTRDDPGHYSVIQVTDHGHEQMVATCLPIPGGAPDPGLVPAIRRVASTGYNAVDEMERRERLRIKGVADRQHEENGPAMEKAYHQFLRNTGQNQRRIFVP